MKREIKFRGLTLDKTEWIYGTPIIGMLGSFILPVDLQFPNATMGNDLVEVIPETVGELIMSKSHEYNPCGMDIFQGDIIRDWNGVREVKFEITDDMQGYDLELDDNDFEVIGNIHQNPELLKNK